MPRKQQGWITFQCSTEERQLLDLYCQQSKRTKTDVLRSLIRSLEPQLLKHRRRGGGLMLMSQNSNYFELPGTQTNSHLES
ncbi:MAG: hypothetical protein DSM106950_31035 [Stigonema ocellatum SAG 48.90 = DSM 106950]|nr:hypothetical protein [Stigonema ocellatum SAG 48.90 = DSM 106950]